jgi:hypothetical protein
MTRRCFMAGRRSSGGARWAAALLIACGLTAPALQAREQRARVLLVPGAAPDWVSRVRGQLSDLPASIETVSVAVQDLSPDELRRRLEQIAEQQHVELVASIVRVDRATGDPTEVAIWFAESERLYLRPLAEDWSHLSAPDRSGALELAALSVRSAVRALLLDPAQLEAFAGASESDLAATALAKASPADPESLVSTASTPLAVLPTGVAPLDELPAEPTPAGGVADVSSSGLPSAPLELRWSSELGMVGYMQGEPALAALAFQAGVGLASGAWRLSALGQLGIPSTSSLGPAQLELQRYALLAGVDYSVWNTGPWQLGPLLRGGLTLTERETLTDGEGFAASHSVTQRSLLLGAGWSGEYRWSEQLGFFLRGVLGWQASAGKYAVVTTTGEPVALADAWALQPSVELGGNWHW